MDPIRFPGASTPRSTPEGPPFEAALAQADSAGRNDAERENGAPGAVAPESSPSHGDERPERPIAVEEGAGPSEVEEIDASFEPEDGTILETASPLPGIVDSHRDDASHVTVPGLSPDLGVSMIEEMSSFSVQSAPTAGEGATSVVSGLDPGAGPSTDQIGSAAMIQPVRPEGSPVLSAADGLVPSDGMDGMDGERAAASIRPVDRSSESAVNTTIGEEGTTFTPDPGTQERSGEGPLETAVGRENPSTVAVRPGPETNSAPTADSSGRIAVPDARKPVAAANRSTVDRPVRNSKPRADSESVEETRPAAVARAEKVNEAVREARSVSPGVTLVDPGSETMPRTAGRLPGGTAQTLPSTSAGAAPNPAEEGSGRTMPGVGRGLDTLSRQRGGTLTMRLDPPSLGQLKLEMKMEGGRVTVLLTSANDSARSLLRDNLNSLRQSLEDRGLAVDRLAVESAGKTSEGSSNQRSENRGDGQDARDGQEAADRQDAGDGRSRGRREDASDRKADPGSDSQRPEVASFGEAMVEASASGN